MFGNKFEVQGIPVTVWGKSFRVEGMDELFYCGKPIDEKEVAHLVSAIYKSVKTKAKQDAITEVATRTAHLVAKSLLE